MSKIFDRICLVLGFIIGLLGQFIWGIVCGVCLCIFFFRIAMDAGYIWGFIAIILFPLTYILTPWYILLTQNFWDPLYISYGAVIAGRMLIKLGDVVTDLALTDMKTSSKILKFICLTYGMINVGFAIFILLTQCGYFFMRDLIFIAENAGYIWSFIALILWPLTYIFTPLYIGITQGNWEPLSLSYFAVIIAIILSRFGCNISCFALNGINIRDRTFQRRGMCH